MEGRKLFFLKGFVGNFVIYNEQNLADGKNVNDEHAHRTVAPNYPSEA